MGFDRARLTAIAEDLNEVLASGDPSRLAAALGKLAREHGMREVAAAAGLSREALYKALRPNAKPRFDTINRVCGALGLQLTAKRAAAPAPKAPARSKVR